MDDYILPESKMAVRKHTVALIKGEIEKVLGLMDVDAWNYALDKAEWKSFAKIMMKIVEKRLEKSKCEDEYGKEAMEYLGMQVSLSEEEAIHLDLFH